LHCTAEYTSIGTTLVGLLAPRHAIFHRRSFIGLLFSLRVVTRLLRLLCTVAVTRVALVLEYTVVILWVLMICRMDIAIPRCCSLQGRLGGDEKPCPLGWIHPVESRSSIAISVAPKTASDKALSGRCSKQSWRPANLPPNGQSLSHLSRPRQTIWYTRHHILLTFWVCRERIQNY
jgi:hypothetical protein